MRLIIVVPFLVLLIIFFLLNMTPVPMNFFSANWQSSVGMIVLLAGIISFAIGALTVFTSLVSQWKRARKAEQKIRDLETQLNELRAQYIALTQQNTTQQGTGQNGTPVPTATSAFSSAEVEPSQQNSEE
nr:MULTISPECIES: LapA family protein [unclassified Commensalibacter]